MAHPTPRSQATHHTRPPLYRAIQCGSPLHIQTAVRVERVTVNGDATVTELLGDPDVQRIIAGKMLGNERFRAELEVIAKV